MKIHKDGTLEGKPDELAEYLKLQAGQQLLKFIGPLIPRTGDPYILPNTVISTTGIDAGKYPGSEHGPYRLDGTTNPYDRSKAIFAFNGNPNTDGYYAITFAGEMVVPENTGVIS